MKRIAVYTAAAALLAAPWLAQQPASAPAVGQNLAICVDPGDAAPSNVERVSYQIPPAGPIAKVQAQDSILACGHAPGRPPGRDCVPVVKVGCR
jgi:hypothetical protein